MGHVECTGSLPTSEVKRRRARLVLGWGTAREDLRVLPAFRFPEGKLPSNPRAGSGAALYHWNCTHVLRSCDFFFQRGKPSECTLLDPHGLQRLSLRETPWILIPKDPKRLPIPETLTPTDSQNVLGHQHISKTKCLSVFGDWPSTKPLYL